LKELKTSSFTGVNVTYPFKEKVIKYADKVHESSSKVKSANTIIFQKNIIANNTDYSGFIKSYDFHFKQNKPGKILVIGVGGVGRAIIFALSSLGVKELCLLDTDAVKSEYLLKELKQLNINCTPLGHYDFPGCSLGNLEIKNYQWLYDVVYTPAKTIFLNKGKLAGSKIISGIDLFIFQALDSFLLFSNNRFDQQDILKHLDSLRHHYFNILYK
jgi:shikimate dehydrogenase